MKKSYENLLNIKATMESLQTETKDEQKEYFQLQLDEFIQNWNERLNANNANANANNLIDHFNDLDDAN